MGNEKKTAYYHLPGLFEFYELYKAFLPIFRDHREYFYDWCEIGSIYGTCEGSIWGGGRTSSGKADVDDVLKLMDEYGISARLTFSNSLLEMEHLDDRMCNHLCRVFEKKNRENGVIVHSELLTDYLLKKYPDLYLVSSTTKVITDPNGLINEIDRDEFDYVVADFRFNNNLDRLFGLSEKQKDKVEFLVNECCSIGCNERKVCYENVSRKNLGLDVDDHICKFNDTKDGYSFSKAMESPAFIGVDDILDTYLPMGFSNFKIEGRGLGSCLILEFLLYYMVKPRYQINVREMIYLDNMLDLF